MREVNVFITEKNYDLDISELCPSCFDELVEGRIFENLKDMQYMMMALQRSKSVWCIEHGQALPCDTKYVIEKIKSLPKYK